MRGNFLHIFILTVHFLLLMYGDIGVKVKEDFNLNIRFQPSATLTKLSVPNKPIMY